MRPVYAIAAVGIAALFGTAADDKPATFPAGRYVLGGGKDAAKGGDTMELKGFRLRPGQYVISGGPSPADKLLVDDDLTIFQGETALFVDDDHLRSDDDRPTFAGRTLTYHGEPIVLVPDPAKKLRLKATDYFGSEAALGPVWVHRWDGARKRLTAGVREPSADDLPHVFFDQSFSLNDGFDMPERVNRDTATELPERPASLLRR